MRKLLLRVPTLRWCVLQHRLQVRRKRQEAAWEYTNSILAALGNITISWAGIGLILNRFIEAHHNQIGNIAKKGLPRNFTSKLEYLEKVEKHPGWSPDRSTELRAMRLDWPRSMRNGLISPTDY